MTGVETVLAQAVEQTLRDAGAPDPLGVTARVVERVQRELGGQFVYVKVQKPDLGFRDRQVATLYNGRNMRDVCRLFSVSRSTVYRAVKKSRAS